MERDVYVGTYAQPGQAALLRCRVALDRPEARIVKSRAGLIAPSWVVKSRKGVLYAVEERKPEGAVLALAETETGFDVIDRLPSGGADPCHLSLSPEEDLLFAANYTSGSIAMFQLGPKGALERLCCLVRFTGGGAHPVRQQSPHIHFSCMHDERLYICDLGQDAIWRYSVDAGQKCLTALGDPIRLPPGNGVRHLCFTPQDPNWLYCVAELSANLFFFENAGGKWVLRQCLSTLPGGVPEGNGAAAVRMSEDGAFLFVTNRGADCVTLFKVREDGTLALLDVADAGGRCPRDLAVYEQGLLVACQRSNCLSVLRFDPAAGKLRLMPERFEAPSPVCLLKA